jgi:hypothetical protein
VEPGWSRIMATNGECGLGAKLLTTARAADLPLCTKEGGLLLPLHQRH